MFGTNVDALRRRQHGADRRLERRQAWPPATATTAARARPGCSPARARPGPSRGRKLTGAGEVGDGPGNENGKFGTIVALSADGDTALIGAWNDDTSKGAAWVFTRSGAGTWTQQGPKLTGTGEVGEGRFGVAVALSADGDTALIGGLYDNGARGAAWVFTRSGSTWTQEGGKLTGGGEAGESEFGTNVALSADGDTALIGGWRDNGGVGAAWAFVDPPTATTGAATSVGETGATLNGTLGAGGSSTAYFEYGTTTAYGASTCHPERRRLRQPEPACGRHRRACAGNDLPLPTRRRKLRWSGLRRRSDVHDRSPRPRPHDRSDHTPPTRTTSTSPRTRGDVPASCGAARTPVRDEMA